jgi:hypothetical protein
MKGLYYILLFSNLLLLVIKRKQLKSFNYFLIIISAAILTQLIIEIFPSTDSYRFIFYHLYIVAEFICMTFYYKEIIETKPGRKYVWWVFFITLVVLLAVYVYKWPFLLSNSFADFVIAGFSICVYVILYFNSSIRHTENYVRLQSSPVFWINVGNLFFYGGCLFVMGFHQYLLESNRSLATNLLSINHFLNYVLYIFYLVAFICIKR